MERRMKYRNCIFNLYGTLVDIHTDEERPQLWRDMAAYFAAERVHYGPDALHIRFKAICRSLDRESPLRKGAKEPHPEIRMEEVFLSLYAEKGVLAGIEQAERAARYFREKSTDYIRLYPGAKELLSRLRSEGRGVYLLANAQRTFAMWELEHLGLADAFDGMLISSDCGVRKPDKRFFDMLLRRCGIAAGSAVMIGSDGRCDVAGAKKAGLSSVYIRSNLSPNEPQPDADYVLDHMDLARVGDILLQNE